MKNTPEEDEEEPLSPMARVFQSPVVDICAIVDFGFKTKINPEIVLDALRQNVYKHPRFSSKLSENGAKWIETEVNVEDHVIVPYIDPEEIGESGQSFVDDYISRLTTIPLDRSRPLWDIHILNVKTTDAEAVGVLRFNHALADGMSFFSLVLACTHKTSNPDVLSTSNPSVKRRTTMPHNVEKTGWFPRTMFTIGSTMRLIWNTFVDFLLLSATMLFLKDTKTPLTGGVDVRTNPKRFYHRNISLDDVKLIRRGTVFEEIEITSREETIKTRRDHTAEIRLVSTIETLVVSSSMIRYRNIDDLVQNCTGSEFKTTPTGEMDYFLIAYVDSCEIAPKKKKTE